MLLTDILNFYIFRIANPASVRQESMLSAG